MKKIILTCILIISCFFAFAQSAHKDAAPLNDNQAKCTIEPYKGKTYIFDGNTKIVECDQLGRKTGPELVAPQGTVFTVMHVNGDNCELAIIFDGVFKDIEEKKAFNYKDISLGKRDIDANQNVRLFVLTKDDFTNSCSPYTGSDNWDISFGTFVTPFKFRPTKSLFTSNLNLGSNVYFKYNLSHNWSIGAVVGISLSSVTLDSLSTNYKVKTSTDRPALTPSLSFVLGYKTINFSIGPGIDYINKTSEVEKAWIFNGKPWIGFGIGINLFTSNNGTVATAKNDDQKGKP